MSGYLESLRAHQVSQAQPVAQVTLLPVGRATWAELRQTEPTQSQGRFCRAQNTHSLLWVLPQSSTWHRVLMYEVLCVLEGKWLPFINSLRLQNSSCKEPPRSLQGNQNTSLFPECQVRAQILLCTAIFILISACCQEKIHHQGSKLLNDTQLNIQINYFSHFESLGY